MVDTGTGGGGGGGGDGGGGQRMMAGLNSSVVSSKKMAAGTMLSGMAKKADVFVAVLLWSATDRHSRCHAGVMVMKVWATSAGAKAFMLVLTNALASEPPRRAHTQYV